MEQFVIKGGAHLVGKIKISGAKNSALPIIAASLLTDRKVVLENIPDLIDKLFACENPYTCPHGRPIVLKFTLDDLGARFGRK